MPHAPTNHSLPTLPVPESAPAQAEPQRGEAHGLALIAVIEARLVLETVATGRSPVA